MPQIRGHLAISCIKDIFFNQIITIQFMHSYWIISDTIALRISEHKHFESSEKKEDKIQPIADELQVYLESNVQI